MKLFPISCLPICLLLTSLGCSQQQGDKDAQRIADANAQIQKEAGIFSPAKYGDTSRQHLGVTIHYENGTFTPDTNISVRQGRLPYLQKNDQPFQVVYKDANGRQLGVYRIEDPSTITSCDSSGKPFIKQLQTGSFDLLLPYNAAISQVEFRSGDKKVSEFKISIPARGEQTSPRTKP